MRNLLLLAVGMTFSFGVAQAQYEALVTQKLERLEMMQTKVEGMSHLTAADKAWALAEIKESQIILRESDSADIDQLQAVEQAINETCAIITERVLAAKKAKLMGRIVMLDAMIEQYQSEGLDTAELEALSDSMKVQVEGLME